MSYSTQSHIQWRQQASSHIKKFNLFLFFYLDPANSNSTLMFISLNMIKAYNIKCWQFFTYKWNQIKIRNCCSLHQTSNLCRRLFCINTRILTGIWHTNDTCPFVSLLFVCYIGNRKSLLSKWKCTMTFWNVYVGGVRIKVNSFCNNLASWLSHLWW